MNERTLVTIMFLLAGAGAGAWLATAWGVASWLDAKPYIAAGALVGALLARLIHAVLSRGGKH